MVDIDHQVRYWREGACEEWEVAGELLQKGRARHALFFAHLAIEKAPKARVCQRTRDLAPRTHNMVRLAEVAGLALEPGRLRVLTDLNAYAEAGRYPEGPGPALATDFDRAITRQDVELLWLAAARTDSRIEPIPCGERQWLDDDKHAIIEIARREGLMILAEAA